MQQFSLKCKIKAEKKYGEKKVTCANVDKTEFNIIIDR